MRKNLSFKSRSIDNAASGHFEEHKKVLIACNQIMGMGVDGKCQKIVVGLVTAYSNLLSGNKFLTNQLHKLEQGFHFWLWKIVNKLRTAGNFANLVKQFIANDELDVLITQQVNEFSKSSAYQETNPAIGINNDTKFNFSWHSEFVSPLLLRQECLPRRFRLCGKSRGNESVLYGYSGESMLCQAATANEPASAE